MRHSFPRRLLGPILLLGALAPLLTVTACGPARPPATPPDTRPPTSAEPPVVVVPTPQPTPDATPTEPIPPPVTPRPPIPQTPETKLPTTPVWVRVGLETDLAEIRVPCCAQELFLGTAEKRFRVRAPLTVRPDGQSTGQGHYRLQVAALRDEDQARSLAARLGRDTGEPAEVVFDAGSGFYRVRVGRWDTRPQAEAAQRRLAGRGVPSSFIVSTGADLTGAGFVVSGDAAGRGEPVRLSGRVLSLGHDLDDGSPIGWHGRSFRGRLLLFLNDRGKINLINELPLEDYLRSVVPSEMGPELYDRPEALKAQAVAARTYVLRNLGEFRREGYDICATPRCQVYRGVATEHPRSDRAVRDTDSQVLLFRGELADTRYSASCGGHTEDVAVVFPLDRKTYLQGVPCPEAGPTTVTGSAAAARAGDRASFVARELTGAEAATSARDLERQLRAVALAAGLVPPRDHLRSADRAEVRRFLTGLLDLRLDPEVLARLGEEPRVAETALRRLADVTDPAHPPGTPPGVQAQSRALLESGLFAADGRGLDGDEVVAAFARLAGAVEHHATRFLALEGTTLAVRSGGATARIRLAPEAGVFTADGRSVARLDLVPGDAVELLTSRDGEVLTLTEGLTAAERGYVHRSRHLSWSRYRSDDTLARQVADRYPGLGFTGLEILSRGVSGRVGRMRVLGSRGRSEVVEGLAVRWTLDVPDTRFQARRVVGSDGRPGWNFDGSGWGHGVGMCQIGAVNLAGRGAGYRAVLDHYYTDLDLVRLPAAPTAASSGGMARSVHPDTIRTEDRSAE